MAEREVQVREVRERDILVAPNEYAYVQDLTKGDIVLYVGPTKISLSNTERLVILSEGRFVPVRGDEAGVGVHKFVDASSSQYIILENPPTDGSGKPVKGANSAIGLQSGRKIVVPGPAEFPLWPGQRAQVIGGHELRQDQYLIARVYDEVEDESPIGTEIIISGTDVSFYIPDTGLEVVPENGKYVRQAWRLQQSMGLHVRVVKPFEAKEGDQLPAGRYEPGQDLFIRGREGFFFPTESLEVVGEIWPKPLAEKDGIYIRKLDTGIITTVEGPVNYLPDPRTEELVPRDLDPATLALYGIRRAEPGRAVSIYVPPSTAVMVTAKNKREVVQGPATRILHFEEDLEVLTLSTGRPKSRDSMLPTCFLQIEGNKVSDVVRVKTADHVELEVLLSYRVSFVGDDPERWFAVKDYVGLLCDHLGSIIRAAARASSIELFHASSTDVLRTAILGARQEDGKRAGRHFGENGMWVYDVEVLDVQILDRAVKDLLQAAQRKAIVSEISRKQEQLRLGDEKLKESVNQEIYGAQITTLAKSVELEAARRENVLARAGTTMELDKLEQVSKAEHAAEALQIQSNARLIVEEREAEMRRATLIARAEAFRSQMEALQPELIATLKVLGNKQLAGELSKNLSPLAILGGESVADVAGRLLEALPLGTGGTYGTNGADIRSVLEMVRQDEES